MSNTNRPTAPTYCHRCGRTPHPASAPHTLDHCERMAQPITPDKAALNLVNELARAHPELTTRNVIDLLSDLFTHPEGVTR